ncbi:MAG: hypothetical protein WD016_13785 [Balneolaceae bacterium]
MKIKLNSYFLSLLALCSFFLTTCINAPDPPQDYANVEGLVTENGSPVVDAEIHIKSHFEPGGFVEGEVDEVEIGFTATASGVYALELYRLGSLQPFVTVFEDTLETGEQLLPIPDSLLSNGVYVYQIVTPLDQTAENNFLINKPDSALASTQPLTRTNSEGEFEISADYLAIESLFSRGQNEQFEITDSLQIIVVRDEEIVAKEFLQVGVEGEGTFVEITID